MTAPTQTGWSPPPRSDPAGPPRRGWSISPIVATQSWSLMRMATRRPRRGASRRMPTLPTATATSSSSVPWTPTTTSPSRMVPCQSPASPHDCTPRAHSHQSLIHCCGRRNHGHHNANRVARRIGVTMSRSQGWSVSPQKTTGRLLSNITHGLIAPSRVTQTLFQDNGCQSILNYLSSREDAGGAH